MVTCIQNVQTPCRRIADLIVSKLAVPPTSLSKVNAYFTFYVIQNDICKGTAFEKIDLP
jgi:hypothetical protein